MKKYKNDLYLQDCLERGRYSNPMVYSADGIHRSEALAAHRRLASLLGSKLKQ